MRLRSLVAAHLVLGIPLVAAVLLAPGHAEAVGTVDLSWDACAPIVAERMRDGSHPYSLYASVLGHELPHQAYSVFIRVERDYDGVGPYFPYPDAWRFDAPGCQTSSLLRMDLLAPASVVKVCPSFSQPNPVLEIRDFQFDPVVDRARGVLACSYPNGIQTSNPAQRYFLGRFEFDHTFSVVGPGTPGNPGEPALTCGEFERDMRFVITRATWLDPSGVERNWTLGQDRVVFCSSCTPTPAVPATWGAIKGQYRR